MASALASAEPGALVEDDIDQPRFFKAALETLPADVDTADSLASALASAEPGA
ncbi:transcriptional regulator, partial [Stenotrophomonas maltophilia]